MVLNKKIRLKILKIFQLNQCTIYILNWVKHRSRFVSKFKGPTKLRQRYQVRWPKFDFFLKTNFETNQSWINIQISLIKLTVKSSSFMKNWTKSIERMVLENLLQLFILEPMKLTDKNDSHLKIIQSHLHHLRPVLLLYSVEFLRGWPSTYRRLR